MERSLNTPFHLLYCATFVTFTAISLPLSFVAFSKSTISPVFNDLYPYAAIPE